MKSLILVFIMSVMAFGEGYTISLSDVDFK